MAAKPKRYPLTTAQKMHFYTLKYCPKPEVLNIGTSLTIYDDIDFDVLRTAITQSYERCEAMRIRFHEDKRGTVRQYVAEKEEREIEFFDFTGWKYEDAEDELRRWTAIPFERQDSPMSRMVMIIMPDGYKGLYFNVDHMIMDSYAIITFMQDIIEIYCSIKFDYPYPKPLASYIKILEKDLAYEADPELQKRDKQFWMETLKQPEPMFTDLIGPKRLEEQRKELGKPELRAATITSQSVDAKHRSFHLEKEPSDRLMQFCQEVKLPMVCLLMMGLRTYLSKMNGNEPDVSIKSTVSRRGTLLEKKSGGTRIHFFPCRTVISEDATFLEGMKAIQEAQNAIFRHANFNPVDYLNMRAKKYQTLPGQSYECMSLTYQPLSMRSNEEHLKDLKYKCKWYSNGAAASPLYLTVMHNAELEGLDFYFEYQSGHVTEQELEILYYYLCKIIFLGAEHPDMTIGEILRTV